MRRFYENHPEEYDGARRGLIDDNAGNGGGTAAAALGSRNFTAMFRQGNVHATDYFTTLAGESYLWSRGCGAGGYTRCNGIGTTDDFAAMNRQTVFTALFGSYFGDWDNEDNLLRAPLASPGEPLVCFWRPMTPWRAITCTERRDSAVSAAGTGGASPARRADRRTTEEELKSEEHARHNLETRAWPRRRGQALLSSWNKTKRDTKHRGATMTPRPRQQSPHERHLDRLGGAREGRLQEVDT